MRFLVPLFVFLAVAAFQSALSAHVEFAEKEEAVSQHDGLSDLQKIDQMEFEAAQKNEATQMNVTEEQNDGSRYLEASQDGSVEERVEGVDISTAEGGGNSDSATREGSESGSSEEADGRQRREHHEAKPEAMSSVDESRQDSTKEQGPRMHCPCPKRCRKDNFKMDMYWSEKAQEACDPDSSPSA